MSHARPVRPVVCLLCPGRGSRAGGIGRFVEALTAEAGGIDPAIDLRLLDTRGSGHILFAPFYFARALGCVVRLAGGDRPVLLHLNLAERGSTVRKLVASGLAALLGLPTVIHLHASDYGGYFAALPAAGRRAIRWMFRRSRRVVVLGEVWRRVVVATVEVPAAQVVIIPNGVPRRPPGACRQAAAVPEILFLGRLEPRKGVPELLHALADPALRALPWRATLAGDGDATRWLALAESLGIAGRIGFPGWLCGDETCRRLAGATLLTLPSHAEGLPMAVLEALAAGVPVVTTPVGALGGALADGDSVLFVPPGDVPALSAALRRLLTDPALAGRIGAAGQRVFEHDFDIAVIARRFIALWRDCLETGRQAAPHPAGWNR